MINSVIKQSLDMHWNNLLALKVSNHAEKGSVTSDFKDSTSFSLRTIGEKLKVKKIVTLKKIKIVKTDQNQD